MKRWLVAPLACALLLAACGESVTEPDALRPMDEAAATVIAAAVVDATDARLPYLPRLVHEALQAVHDNDDNVEAATAFRRARHARRAAWAAHEAGDEEEFKRLKRVELRFTLEGVIAALGPSVVTDALAGVDAALARWQERVTDHNVLPPRFARALARVQALADKAHNADSQVASLYFSVTAADVILSLSPRHQALKAIQRAARLFGAARAAVGDAPTEDEVKALRRARRLLGVAEEAFEAKDWRLAKRAANASAELSQRVLDG